MHHGNAERQTYVHTGKANVLTMSPPAVDFTMFLICDPVAVGKVCVEGRLYLEFMFDDMMRIKTWHFSIRQHREVLPRSILAMHVSLRVHKENQILFLPLALILFPCFSLKQDPQMLDQLAKNITRCGLSNSTLNYLRVSKTFE